MDTNEVATEPTSPEGPRLSKDKLGRRHHQDANGRFVKQNGKVDPIIAARLEGKRLLPNVDQRSLPYQRYKEIIKQMAVDAGGVENLTAARAQLIRRFSAASVLAEQMEVRIAKGELVNITEFSALSSTLVRLGRLVGVERRSKDIYPNN